MRDGTLVFEFAERALRITGNDKSKQQAIEQFSRALYLDAHGSIRQELGDKGIRQQVLVKG